MWCNFGISNLYNTQVTLCQTQKNWMCVSGGFSQSQSHIVFIKEDTTHSTQIPTMTCNANPDLPPFRVTHEDVHITVVI